MGKIIDAMYQPMTVTGKYIDPRYFKHNDDGTYTLTPLMIYNIARDAEEYFRQRIYAIDENKLYHSESVREVKYVWTEKEQHEKWRIKYGSKLKLANERWKAYRDEHPDEFVSGVKRIATGGEDENRYFDSYTPFITQNLESTIQAYNAARKLLTKYKSGGSKYDTLPFEEPLYSKEKFADIHKAVKAKIYSDLKIPREVEVGKVEKVICRINNKKCNDIGSDESELEGFYKGLINHITASKAAEYKKDLRKDKKKS